MKSKKILIVIPHLGIGGTEIQTLSLAEALMRNGYEVSVLCYYRNISEVVEKFKRKGCKVLVLSPEYDHYGINIKYHKGWKLIKFLIKGIRNAINECRPDVAHVQYMAPGALTIFILKVLGVRKVVATTHTDANIYSKNGLRIVRFIAEHLTEVFQCITLRAEKSYFGSASLFDGTLKKHFTIYNALPSHISVRKSPREFNRETVTVGVVSRLAEIKGMDLVIPAFTKVHVKHPDTQLLIVGDGPQRSLMESQAQESGCIDSIEFAGRKGQGELQEWYDKIDILLMPSRSEGFGLTAIEGMARGCVPVVSDTGGLPEVVTADCGLLHRVEDVDDMALQICRLTADPALLDRLSRGCLQRAACFAPNRYQETIDDLYSLL